MPTVTVTVAPLATAGHKIRSQAIVTAAAITRDEKLFIASISQREGSNDLPSYTMLEKYTALVTLIACRSARSKRASRIIECSTPNRQSSKQRAELMMIRESCNLRGAPGSTLSGGSLIFLLRRPMKTSTKLCVVFVGVFPHPFT